VVVETGLGVVEVLVDEEDLTGDIVEGGGVGEGLAVGGEEGRAHVEAVEPHLVRVTLLVPETALAGARLLGELLAQGGERACADVPRGGGPALRAARGRG
jgi:hypothetical protein